MLGKMNSRLAAGLIALSAALCLGGWPTIGQAKGPYIAGRVGVNFPNDSELDPVGFRRDAEVEFNPGPAVAGAVGYRSSRSLRIEGEISWRRNGLDEIKAGRLSGEFEDGNLSALGFLANVLYDFDNASAVTPYVGGGVGFSRIALNDPNVRGIQGEDEEDVVFAYQASGGLNFQLTEKVDLNAGYRYYRTSDPDFNGTEIDYHNHSLIAGLRYNL